MLINPSDISDCTIFINKLCNVCLCDVNVNVKATRSYKTLLSEWLKCFNSMSHYLNIQRMPEANASTTLSLSLEPSKAFKCQWKSIQQKTFPKPTQKYRLIQFLIKYVNVILIHYLINRSLLPVKKSN